MQLYINLEAQSYCRKPTAAAALQWPCIVAIPQQLQLVIGHEAGKALRRPVYHCLNPSVSQPVAVEAQRQYADKARR